MIFLTDQTMNFTIPDGSKEPASVEAGALGCSDGNVHLPENVEGEAEFIMVEFKDRKTFQKIRRDRSSSFGLPRGSCVGRPASFSQEQPKCRDYRLHRLASAITSWTKRSFSITGSDSTNG